MTTTRGALKAAEIILNGKPDILTAYGRKRIDGLDLGYTACRSKIFYLTPEGIERKGKLWKTFDPWLVAEKIAVQCPKITTTIIIKEEEGK